MSEIRDRSVVRSSVIPSTKYCWSGSLLRLAKGSTTIDIRGATSGCAIDVAAAMAGVGGGFVADNSHHAQAARTSAVPAAVAIATRVMARRCGGKIGVLDAGESATASACTG